MTLRRISGALEPKAISVKLATVGFQTFTFVFTNSYRYGSYFITTLFEDVMTSIALKISKTVLIDLLVCRMAAYLLHKDISDNVHSEEHPEKE